MAPGNLLDFFLSLILLPMTVLKQLARALDVGVSVKMLTGDQLAIAKETGRRLGMGTNMYLSSSLLTATERRLKFFNDL